MSSNIKQIFNYLVKLYPNDAWDEVEQDINDGYTTLNDELFNAYNRLIKYKSKIKTQKEITTINQYLRMLRQFNIRVVA